MNWKAGSTEELQVRVVLDLSQLSEKDFTDFREACRVIDRISIEQGSMTLVPGLLPKQGALPETDLDRASTVILGWERFFNKKA